LFILFTPSFEGSLEGLPPLRRRGGHGEVISQGQAAVSVDDRKIRVKFRYWRFCLCGMLGLADAAVAEGKVCDAQAAEPAESGRVVNLANRR
jgi:hypothetical protein